MANSEQSLSNIVLFRGLSAADLATIEQRCTRRRYVEGQQIIAHRDDSSDVYFVVAGAILVTFFTKAGKQVSFRDTKAGGFFGELAAIDGNRRSASVVAVDDSLIASMPAEAFRKILRQYEAVNDALLRYFAGQVRDLTERVIEYTALDVNGRIHAELLRLARDHMISDNTADIAPMPTHAELASRVSTHREAVTREINYLDRAGLLERHTGHLVIRNVAALAKMVEKVLGE